MGPRVGHPQSGYTTAGHVWLTQNSDTVDKLLTEVSVLLLFLQLTEYIMLKDIIVGITDLSLAAYVTKSAYKLIYLLMLTVSVSFACMQNTDGTLLSTA